MHVERQLYLIVCYERIELMRFGSKNVPKTFNRFVHFYFEVYVGHFTGFCLDYSLHIVLNRHFDEQGPFLNLNRQSILTYSKTHVYTKNGHDNHSLIFPSSTPLHTLKSAWWPVNNRIGHSNFVDLIFFLFRSAPTHSEALRAPWIHLITFIWTRLLYMAATKLLFLLLDLAMFCLLVVFRQDWHSILCAHTRTHSATSIQPIHA